MDDLIQLYEAAVKENKVPFFDVDDYMDISEYYWELGDMEMFDQTVSNAHIIHPENESLCRMQIELYIDSQQPEKARNLLNNCKHRNTRWAQVLSAELYMYEGRVEDAKELLSMLMQTDYDTDIFLGIAETYCDLEDWKHALECYNEIELREPENVDMLEDKAMVYQKMRKYEDAMAYHNKVLDHNPYAFKPWLQLADCYLNLKKYDKVIEATEFAMVIAPEVNDSYYYRSYAFMMLGNYEKCIADLLKVRSSVYGSMNYHLSKTIGECYLKLKDFNAALPYLQEAYKMMSKTNEPFYTQTVFGIIYCRVYQQAPEEELMGYLKEADLGYLSLEDVERLVAEDLLEDLDESADDVDFEDFSRDDFTFDIFATDEYKDFDFDDDDFDDDDFDDDDFDDDDFDDDSGGSGGRNIAPF